MSERITAWAAQAQALWDPAVEIWVAGGWAMWPIAAIALVMFAYGVHVWLRLSEAGFRSVPETTWRGWIDRPEERRGAIGELLDRVAGASSHAELDALFEGLAKTETVPFQRDLKVMKVCVNAAPLVGLLGTVTGMLATFGALATGSGGEKTMSLVAQGISEALITTETGLVIALPGLFLQYLLTRQHQRYEAFLVHVHSVLTQMIHKRASHAARRSSRQAALREVARDLHHRLERLTSVAG